MEPQHESNEQTYWQAGISPCMYSAKQANKYAKEGWPVHQQPPFHLTCITTGANTMSPCTAVKVTLQAPPGGASSLRSLNTTLPSDVLVAEVWSYVTPPSCTSARTVTPSTPM